MIRSFQYPNGAETRLPPVTGLDPGPALGIGAVRFLDYHTIHDPSGNMAPIEECLDVPFMLRPGVPGEPVQAQTSLGSGP